MESKVTSVAVRPRHAIGFFPFVLLYLVSAVLNSLFPLLAFGPSHYGGLSLRLSGWALLLEMAAPLVFSGLMLAVLLVLWGRRDETGIGIKNALCAHRAGDVVFLVLTAAAAFWTVYPGNHIGYGQSGAPYITGMSLSFLWQAVVSVGFAVVPVYILLPALQKRIKPGTAAWAGFGIVLLVQALAMAAFRLLWQWLAQPANLMLLDILPNAIAPVLIGMIPVMLSIIICQRSRRGSIWPAAFAAALSSALWAATSPVLGAVLGGMGMGDSTYLVLVHMVFTVLMLIVFAVLSLTIGRKLKKAKAAKGM